MARAHHNYGDGTPPDHSRIQTAGLANHSLIQIAGLAVRDDMRFKLILPAAGLVLATALSACGSGSQTHTRTHASTPPPPAAPRHVSLAISGYAFHPATITVAPGAKVTFTNHDKTAHTATSTGSAFDSGTLKPGQSATVTLRKPGTYTYYCQFHAFMRGTIVVR
jgi:plastocyanin